MEVIRIVNSALYIIVGLITFGIGLKFLLSKNFFSYHREATGLEWNNIDKSLQMIILAIMKMAGIGIICLSVLIITYPFVLMNSDNFFDKYLVSIISLIFWIGSFSITFNVHKKTNANTPWKGSLFSIILIVIAILLSVL